MAMLLTVWEIFSRIELENCHFRPLYCDYNPPPVRRNTNNIKVIYILNYISLIVTLYLSPTIFEILTHKVRKQLVFPTAHLFNAPFKEPNRISG